MILHLLALFLLSWDVKLGLAVQCPSSVLISPCNCSVESGQFLQLKCSGIDSVKSLSDIFSRKFPANDFQRIDITDSQLGPLPNDVFNGKSFAIIRFSANRRTSFENAKIFSSSKARLTSLTIDQDTDEWSFNAANIVDFKALSHLEVSGYDMQLVGSLANPALKTLVLRSYLMSSLPALGKLPSLQTLDLDGNVLAQLSANYFAALPTVTSVYLGHNKLVALGSSTLAFSGSMSLIDLSSNIIDTIEKGWITGCYSILMHSDFSSTVPQNLIYNPT